MKLMLPVAVVAVTLGIWAGLDNWQSTTFHSGLAVLVGGNMLICSVAWLRAKPGSGDALVLPTLMLLSAAMLIGILPRLLWPSNDGGHLAGSIASALIVAVIVVVQLRKRRRLRDHT